MPGELAMYTIYDHPADYPQGFVMTHWVVGAGRQRRVATVYASTLERVRMLVPAGLICMARSPEDDPVIMETWF